MTHEDLAHRADQAGPAGASVFRGVEGYGRSSHIHITRLPSLSEIPPVSVVVVDIGGSVADARGDAPVGPAS